MAAIIGRTEIEIKKSPSTKADIPDNPIAKLMYYFNCICVCVEADDDPNIRRFRDYKNYYNLSQQEKAQLLALCLALSPDKLIGSIFFAVDDDSDFGGLTNHFFQVSAVSTKLIVAESLLIGGQQKKVRKIMKFKKSWVESYYLNPLRSISQGGQRSQQRALPAPRQRRNDSSCSIL